MALRCYLFEHPFGDVYRWYQEERGRVSLVLVLYDDGHLRHIVQEWTSPSRLDFLPGVVRLA